MDRRAFIAAVTGSLLAAPLAAEAQPAARIPRVGVLAPGAGPTSGTPLLAPVEAFLKGLRDYGYILGQNLTLDTRRDEGRPEQTRSAGAGVRRRRCRCHRGVDDCVNSGRTQVNQNDTHCDGSVGRR